SKDIMLHLIKEILPIGFKGIVIAGLFAVVMSTTDSMLNTASLTFSHDILGSIFRNKKYKINYLLVARICTVILGIAAILIALLFENLISVIINVTTVWIIIAIPLFMALLGLKLNEECFLTTIS